MLSEWKYGADLEPEQWDEIFWGKDFLPFHENEPHSMITKHFDHINKDREPGRIFVPLCGKSVDMIWFEQRGFEVVGVEFSQIAISSFFQENELEFTVHDVEGNAPFPCYKAKEKKISIFKADFFEILQDSQILGEFDLIWDRGSYTSFGQLRRKMYSELMKNVVKPNTIYLLYTLTYESPHGGVPHSIDDEEVQNFFGRYFAVEFLEMKPFPHQYLKGLGGKNSRGSLFKLIPK